MAIPVIDGNNNLQYAETAKGDGTAVNPFVWRHSDLELATAIGDPVSTPASASVLASAAATSYNTIALLKALVLQNASLVAAQTASPLAWENYFNPGSAVSAVVKSSPGKVSGLFCQNLSNAVRYLQIHDATAIPATGATPLFALPVETRRLEKAGTELWGSTGLNFPKGIVFAFSTTAGTYTPGTAIDHVTHIFYR